MTVVSNLVENQKECVQLLFENVQKNNLNLCLHWTSFGPQHKNKMWPAAAAGYDRLVYGCDGYTDKYKWNACKYTKDDKTT